MIYLKFYSYIVLFETCPGLLFLEPFATIPLNTCVCQRTAGVGAGQARVHTDDGQQRKPWARVRGATSSGGLDSIGMLRKLSVGVRGLGRTISHVSHC